VLAASGDPTLLGVAAIVSALGGVVSTILAHRSAKKEAKRKADEECLERLRATRVEAEQLAEELHRMKMGRFQ
jgi:uncharacterized membrane protein (DUF106 family)